MSDGGEVQQKEEINEKRNEASGKRASIEVSGTKVDIIEELPNFSTHPLNNLEDVELIQLVQSRQFELKITGIENLVFQNFLNKSDPTVLEGLDKIITKAIQVQEQTGRRKSSGNSSRLGSIGRLSFMGSSIGSTCDKSLRVNLTQKMELVLLEMEDTQVDLERYINKSHRNKRNLLAELEEISIREAETKEAMNIFDKTILNDAVDKLTQKIPLEKFIRYIKEWLKSSEHTINKIRLRTSSMKTQLYKLNQILTQKQMLGETIQNVDFEQLQIENSHLKTKINMKTNLLLDMKQINGTANLDLTIQKKKLLKQLEEIKKLKEKISIKENSIMKLDEQSEIISNELNQQRIKYDNLKETLNRYEAPEIMEYMKTKTEFDNLKKQIKIWSRRKQIKDMALTSCLREMKHLTGSKTIKPSWFMEPQESDSSIMTPTEDEYQIPTRDATTESRQK